MTEIKPDHETKALTAPQSITPQLWGMLKDIGDAFCQSQKMGIHTAAEGAIKALFCLENQLPLTAARGLFFVSGKLGIESGVIAALLRRHPDYDYDIVNLDDKGCTVAIFRRGEDDDFHKVGEVTFDESHAKQANLLGKTNWKTYPEDMYFAKAITRAQRRYAPDVFMAPVYASEEMQEWDVVDVEPLPPLPAKKKPPEFDQLIEKFGLEACTEAGVFNATTEPELWDAVDRLAIQAASEEKENET